MNLKFKLKVKPFFLDGIWVLKIYPSPFTRVLSTIDSAVIQFTEQKELRTLDQNALYWTIIRQIAVMHQDATNEYWPEHAIHEHNLQNLLGLQPRVIMIGDHEVRTYDFNSDEARILFESQEITMTNTQLKSSTMSASLFSFLIGKTIAYFAEHYGYVVKIDSDGQDNF